MPLRKSLFALVFSLFALGQLLAGPVVEIETSMGKIVAELNDAKAPKTVANFLKYVESGHYNGVVFHRVIDNFMIQTGGFALLEGGKIEQKEVGDSVENEANNGLGNEFGTLAMARTRDPHSASAQFFINLKDNAFLNHTAPTQSGWGYAVFGKVIEGEDVVKAIGKVATGTRTLHARLGSQVSARPFDDVPQEDVVIKSVKLRAAG